MGTRNLLFGRATGSVIVLAETRDNEKENWIRIKIKFNIIALI